MGAEKIIRADKLLGTLGKMAEGSLEFDLNGKWVDEELKKAAEKAYASIKAEANALVKRHRPSGGYHDSITIGKPYWYQGIRSIRVYAKRPIGSNANLIEYGWFVNSIENPRKIPGKHIFDAGSVGIEDEAAGLFVESAARKLEEMIR